MQFEIAAQTLCDAGVDFVVIGGLSATFHGSARVTYDLEICYSRASANLRRLTAALAPFHPRPRGFPSGLPFVWDEGTLRNGTMFTLQTDIGAIDLLAEVAGLGAFDDVKRHSITVAAFDRQIATLDLPGPIQAKRATGRHKDRSALPELDSLLEAGDLKPGPISGVGLQVSVAADPPQDVGRDTSKWLCEALVSHGRQPGEMAMRLRVPGRARDLPIRTTKQCLNIRRPWRTIGWRILRYGSSQALDCLWGRLAVARLPLCCRSRQW